MSSPAERAARKDLEGSEFIGGVLVGSWRLVRIEWPDVIIAVTAGDGHELAMKINLEDYPSSAPAGEPWDLESNQPLAPVLWPVGGGAELIFRRDWSIGNGNSPYIAADRRALKDHNWVAEHPERAWHAGRTIAFYVAEISRELEGARLPRREAA